MNANFLTNHRFADRRRLSIAAALVLLCLFGLTSSSKATVVAVIDTGADVTHPALRKSLWTNAGETGLDDKGRDKATNGIDDDGNGFVDDVHGWNFSAHTADVRDRHGHGTHVAGLIATLGRPATAPAPADVRLMILKYYDPGSAEDMNVRNSVAAIRYAVRMGARIINYSGGGLGKDPFEEEAIREASARGILFVAAAGNERSDSDRRGYFPADYDLPNILSVAAVGDDGRLTSSSNFGRKTVDLAAPGKEVLSSMPGGMWGRMTGTSQAAALATGAAVRLMARERKSRSPADVIDELVRKAAREPALEGKTKYQVRLDPREFERL